MTPTLSEVNRFSYVYQEVPHRCEVLIVCEDYALLDSTS